MVLGEYNSFDVGRYIPMPKKKPLQLIGQRLRRPK
jgi:hypothetical protein